MSVKQLIFSVYFFIALLFSIYGTFWGESAYRGFFFNLGLSIVWPAIMFPALGKAIGAVLLVAVIGLVLGLKR